MIGMTVQDAMSQLKILLLSEQKSDNGSLTWSPFFLLRLLLHLRRAFLAENQELGIFSMASLEKKKD